MKPTLANRVWHAALALCAVFTLIAVLAQGEWWTPEAILPAVPSAETSSLARVQPLVHHRLPAVPSAETGSLAPAMRAHQGTASEQPPTSPISPPIAATDFGAIDDVSRLRTRGLTLPLPAISAAQLTDTYTQARGDGRVHDALDIMAPRGTPVLAVDDGRVAKLFLSVPGGITLYQFDPNNEYAYYYAHLDRYADGVTEGTALRKGQVIGYVGSTGNASTAAPHLHFAILRLGPERQWWRGTPVNPFLIWRGARQQQ